MFFAISKILGFFATPSNAVVVLCVLGPMFMFMRWQRLGRSILALGIVLLLVFGYSPLGNVLLLTLTERFPAWQENGRAPDGIIVLGGAINPDVTAARGSLELGSSAERVMTMLELARRYPTARIVFTGGSGNLIQNSLSEAPIAGKLLENFGVASGRVTLEGASRTTYENATLSRALINPKPGERWILVTSAYHMPRAIGVFRRAGFDVEAYPVDWETRGWSDAWTLTGKLSMGLTRTDTAMHEWAGLMAYWLTGHSKELLPGPR